MFTSIPKVLFIFSFSLINSLVFSQEIVDALYLKNGSKMYGAIVERKDGSVKFKDIKGNVILFNESEIEKFEKETVDVKSAGQKEPFSYEAVRDKKWYVGAFGGYGGASVTYINTYDDFSYYYTGELYYEEEAFRHFAVAYLNAGYRFNPNLTLGLSLGLSMNKRIRTFPISVEVTYGILKKRITPYITVSGGYNAALRDPEQEYPIPGGAVGAARAGVKYYVNKDIGLMFDVGYKAQQRYLYFPDDWFHGLEARLGFIF